MNIHIQRGRTISRCSPFMATPTPPTIRPQFQALEIRHFFSPHYKTKNARYSECQLEMGFSTWHDILALHSCGMWQAHPHSLETSIHLMVLHRECFSCFQCRVSVQPIIYRASGGHSTNSPGARLIFFFLALGCLASQLWFYIYYVFRKLTSSFPESLYHLTVPLEKTRPSDLSCSCWAMFCASRPHSSLRRRHCRFICTSLMTSHESVSIHMTPLHVLPTFDLNLLDFF